MCRPSGSSLPQNCSCCVLIRFGSLMEQVLTFRSKIRTQRRADRTNGNEPERQTVQENERVSPMETMETAREPVQTSTSAKCTFSRTVILIDPKRFTDSSVSSVECPGCGRTRSLSSVKGVLRFPPNEPRKIQVEAKGKRWSATGKTDWNVVGGE